jgi:hypothetical protein
VSAAVDHREELEREARRAEMSGDPLAPVLRALAGTTEAMDRSVAALAQQVEQNRQPVPKEAVRQAVAEAMRCAMGDVAHAFNRRTLVVATSVVLVLMAGAFGAGYWVHGDRSIIAGLRAGDDTCRPQNGGVLCYIPVWKTLPATSGAR